MLNWIKRHEALILILLLAIILRLPSLFEPYWYGDEGIYLTLGLAFKKGLVWYRDIHDNKPPLLYLLAAFTGTVFWFRLLLTLWFGAAVAIFYRLMQKLLPKTPKAWALATLLLIVLTTVFEGNVSNAEIFIVLPVTLAMFLVFKPKPNWGLIGILFSLGSLFKVPAAFDFLALGLWLFFWQRERLKNLFICGVGFIVPVILSIAYYAYQGAFTPYVRSALMQNIGYLNSWGDNQNGLFIRLVTIAVVSLIFYFVSRRRRLANTASLIVLWFIWAMFGALLSERPYPHYLIQPAVPLAILVTFFLFGRRRLLKIVILGAALMAGAAYYQVRFWQYPIIGYYQNFIAYNLGQKSIDEYRAWFDSRVNQTYRLAAYIRQTTKSDDPIFIWGDEPYVYALARRLPVGRYTVAYHIVDFDGFSTTINSWDKHRPKLVAVMAYETRNFPELKARLATDYVLAATIDQAQIYRRLDGAN